jgi:uncharacterized protein YjbI with pentapeptide repeats
MNKLDFFPLSDQTGSTTNLNSEMMHQMSESSTPISPDEFKVLISEHTLFLESGGKGGTWQNFEVAGLTMGVYIGATADKGKQASFLNSNLSLLNLSNINLECCDFVNIFYKNGNFRNSKLKNSLIIDSILENTDFSGADLMGCDFSRSLMMNCNFSGANLSNCDFENCDLTGSNFTNAITGGSRFPGAKLEQVIF